MKKKIVIMLILSCMFFMVSFSQNSGAVDTKDKLGVKISYFGEFVLHPGLAAGIDYTVHKNNWFTLHWDTETGGYFHKWNNNAFFVQSTLGTRFTAALALYLDVNAGLGYMLASPNGDVYVANSDGEISEKGRPYTSHLKPNISFILGWDGGHKKQLPLKFQAGLEAYWQSHFNHSLLPHAALRAGIIYTLKK